MKKARFVITIGLLIFASQTGFSQYKDTLGPRSQKGRLYFYWGWNWGWYTKSDIQFRGADYDFELKEVVAKDRQSEFGLDPYFNPAKATIPQYNFRVGYFIKDHWDISFGIDHMKYVVQEGQTVKISGHIDDTESAYYGVYSQEDISVTDDFLLFEHTDGLNYINFEFRRSDELYTLGKIRFNLTEGAGIGALYPRTNTTLLSKERYDEFHLSGFGINAILGLNVTFFDVFFIQTEFKGGYINMPDIRTTSSPADKANQSFFFAQQNIVFGGIINIGGSSKVNK